MLTGGIVIDQWKLKIFERHLKEAGFAYKKSRGLTSDTLILKVKTHTQEALAAVVEAANTECARKGNTPH